MSCLYVNENGAVILVEGAAERYYDIRQFLHYNTLHAGMFAAWGSSKTYVWGDPPNFEEEDVVII